MPYHSVESAAQGFEIEAVHAAVDLGRGVLFRCGVGCLHDSNQPAVVVAQQATVALPIFRSHRQHGGVDAIRSSHEGLQRRGQHPGAIAVEHQQGAAGSRQCRTPRGHGVGGAAGSLLHGKRDRIITERGAQGVVFGSDHDVNRIGVERACRPDRMRDQGSAGARMQQFGPRGAHPLAFTGGEDQNVQRHAGGSVDVFFEQRRRELLEPRVAV